MEQKINSNEKWAMFKNFMHNELGVTKDDIRVWIKEAVAEQAERLVAQEFGKFDVQKYITSQVLCKSMWGSQSLQDDIKRQLVAEMMKQLELKVK